MTTSALIPEKNEVAFDLGDLVAFLWQKKFRLILTAILIVALGGYYIVKLPKYYTASSTLMLGSNDSNFNLPKSVASFAGGSDSKMDTYIEFMRSRHFAENMVLALGLHTSKEFQPPKPFGTPQEQLEYSISFFLSNLSLSRLGETDLLRVTYESRNPQQAADIVNYLGPAFFKFYEEMSKQKANEASQWINTQLGLLESKLSDAEVNLQAFMRENRLLDIKSQIDLARTEISALLAEKLLNDKQLASIDATVEQVNAKGNNYQALMQIPWFLQNALVIDLRGKIVAQEQVLAEVSKRYKSKHHRHIAASSKLKGLQDELILLLDNLKASLEQEFNTLKVRSAALERQIDMIKAQHSDLGKHELQLSRLRRDVESTQKLYEVFLGRLQETEILKDLGNTEEFVVVDYATSPRVPSRPKVLILLVVLGLFAGFISVAFWLVLHFMSDKQSRYRQLLQRVNVPVLAEIPRLKVSLSNKGAQAFLAEGQNNYQYAEAVRTLRTALMVSHSDKENRIIALTGVSSGDGQSHVSIALANSFSKLEKTLLVDTDVRTPIIAKAFGVPAGMPGLMNFVEREARFSACLHRSKDSDLTVLHSGTTPADPIAHLSKPRFGGIIKKMGVVFERLIIEAPSVNTYSDALILSKWVDGIILVCDIESTETSELLQAVHRLQDAGAPLIGVVFNRAKGIRYPLRDSRSRRLLRAMFGRS